MAFTIEINKADIFPVIHLKNNAEETSAEIYAFGGLLNKLSIKNSANVIDGFTSPHDAKDNITNGFKSAKLNPFVCRLASGKYSFNNQDYVINKFYLNGEAIHGLLYDALFSITDSGADDKCAFVTLLYQYEKKNEGFPFAYTCTITYRLQPKGRLSVETIIQNNATSPIPVCDGWHPYFTLGGNIDELSFQMNAEKMIEFNDKLIPTGNTVPYKKFQAPELFKDTFLDNCFLLNATDKPACILKNDQIGLQLTIEVDASYPYLQIYTPPHRNSIAIENLSAAPDAFNNKMGLIILAPGESAAFTTSYLLAITL